MPPHRNGREKLTSCATNTSRASCGGVHHVQDELQPDGAVSTKPMHALGRLLLLNLEIVAAGGRPVQEARRTRCEKVGGGCVKRGGQGLSKTPTLSTELLRGPEREHRQVGGGHGGDSFKSPGAGRGYVNSCPNSITRPRGGYLVSSRSAQEAHTPVDGRLPALHARRRLHLLKIVHPRHDVTTTARKTARAAAALTL